MAGTAPTFCNAFVLCPLDQTCTQGNVIFNASAGNCLLKRQANLSASQPQPSSFNLTTFGTTLGSGASHPCLRITSPHLISLIRLE